MDPGPQSPEPEDHRELRILVLHNHDFGREPEEPDPQKDTHAARADVLNAAQDVGRALAARGHFVEVRGIDADDVGALYGRLQKDPPDLVFNLCESLADDARNEVVVPALLDLLGIPYTGSGPLALGLALHKDRAKLLLRAAGVPTPPWVTLPAISAAAEDLALLDDAGLRFPLIVKPSWEDASVGISASSVVGDEAALLAQVAALRGRLRQPILCEEYVAGRELYVSLLGDLALPLTEIDFSRMPQDRPRIVCYDAKWRPGTAAYLGTRSVPATGIDPGLTARIIASARRAAAAVGLRGYGRCDIRLAEDGTPQVIDVNPNCDLSDGAGFSLAARAGGLSYDVLIERIATAALRSEDAQFPGAAPLHDPAAAAARSGPAPRARGKGRAVLDRRGELRPRAHRQRAL